MADRSKGYATPEREKEMLDDVVKAFREVDRTRKEWKDAVQTKYAVIQEAFNYMHMPRVVRYLNDAYGEQKATAQALHVARNQRGEVGPSKRSKQRKKTK